MIQFIYRITYKIGLLILSTSFVLAWADSVADAARMINNKWQDAVVKIEVVRETNEYESKHEAFGTIIDPSGLIIMSLSSMDPSSYYSSGTESKIKSIDIILADGEEIAGKSVVRDKDLDLSFIRPAEELTENITAISLTDSDTAAILDQVVLLSRLGSAFGYASYITLCRVQSIIEKPRKLYVPDFMGIMSGLGTPVFSLDGKLVGILLLRINRSASGGMSGDMYGGIHNMGILPIILPANQIQKIVERIPKD